MMKLTSFNNNLALALAAFIAMPLLAGLSGCDAVLPGGGAATGAGADDDDTPGDGPNANVLMQDFAFVPPTVTISVGDTVRWTNEDAAGHTTTSGNPGDEDAGDIWDSGIVLSGQSYQRTFEEPGDYRYFCELHPNQMANAMVIVEEDDGEN